MKKGKLSMNVDEKTLAKLRETREKFRELTVGEIVDALTEFMEEHFPKFTEKLRKKVEKISEIRKESKAIKRAKRILERAAEAKELLEKYGIGLDGDKDDESDDPQSDALKDIDESDESDVDPDELPK